MEGAKHRTNLDNREKGTEGKGKRDVGGSKRIAGTPPQKSSAEVPLLKPPSPSRNRRGFARTEEVVGLIEGSVTSSRRVIRQRRIITGYATA